VKNKILNKISKTLSGGKKVYFVSDSHLGIPDYQSSLKREKLLVKWLEEIRHDAQEIFFLGDIFEFWFEYRHVVPRGYVRLFGKIAELTDAGIPVNFFIGNHDMWIRDYFVNELGMRIYKKPILCTYNNQTFYIAHGDGLGPGDHGYKLLKKVFSNPLCKWLFARLHPNFAYSIALYFSKRSRLARGESDKIFLGEDEERLILFAKEFSEKQDVDFFIFGHRHLPLNIPLSNNTRYLNSGDWFNNFSYIAYDGKEVYLKKFNSTTGG